MIDALHITLVQPNLHWEAVAANLNMLTEKLEGMEQQSHIIALPEMFNTGFTMQAKLFAEEMNGPTINWMQHWAKKKNAVITGSLIIKQDENYYNRLIWMRPDGKVSCYDKKHLFRLSDEQLTYSAGQKKLIVECEGWRIAPMICYDLRFPVWCRNKATAINIDNNDDRYRGEHDIQLYVANWPERRRLAWRSLLQARAIENQAYVIGVNRVGDDGNGIHHSGDSSVFAPLGDEIVQLNEIEACTTQTLLKKNVIAARRQFPFWKDADRFSILD